MKLNTNPTGNGQENAFYFYSNGSFTLRGVTEITVEEIIALIRAAREGFTAQTPATTDEIFTPANVPTVEVANGELHLATVPGMSELQVHEIAEEVAKLETPVNDPSNGSLDSLHPDLHSDHPLAQIEQRVLEITEATTTVADLTTRIDFYVAALNAKLQNRPEDWVRPVLEAEVVATTPVYDPVATNDRIEAFLKAKGWDQPAEVESFEPAAAEAEQAPAKRREKKDRREKGGNFPTVKNNPHLQKMQEEMDAAATEEIKEATQTEVVKFKNGTTATKLTPKTEAVPNAPVLEAKDACGVREVTTADTPIQVKCEGKDCPNTLALAAIRFHENKFLGICCTKNMPADVRKTLQKVSTDEYQAVLEDRAKAEQAKALVILKDDDVAFADGKNCLSDAERVHYISLAALLTKQDLMENYEFLVVDGLTVGTIAAIEDKAGRSGVDTVKTICASVKQAHVQTTAAAVA